MKKILLTFAIAAFIFGVSAESASAQVGVQAGIAMPTGDWGDFWGMGFGGQVSYKKESGDGMKIGGSVGYFAIPGEDVSGTTLPDITMIPILATFDYSISDNIYVGGDAGYNVISFATGTAAGAGSSLAIIPKAGIKFGALSVEGRYNAVGDSYFSALVGFSFGGK